MKTKSEIPRLLQKRDEHEIGSDVWLEYQELIGEILSMMKPSTNETIVYFDEDDTDVCGDGFQRHQSVPYMEMKTKERKYLEYDPRQRHPIPYACIRFRDDYFFAKRGSGAGEQRLSGKVGCLGGHVGAEDAEEGSLSQTMVNGMMRELEEEAGLTLEDIEDIVFIGTIKGHEGVDADHLGMIYEIRLRHPNITSQEKELEGVWINKEELTSHQESFESWLSIIAKEWLLRNH